MLSTSSHSPPLAHERYSKRTYGVMQGRLVAPEDGRFQSFPRNAWREEIPRAREAGLDYIEWIHDAYGQTANPMFTAHGRVELASLKKQCAIETPAVCADWFMDFPFFRCTELELKEREQHLHALIPLAAAIGAYWIVLPIVDHARIENSVDEETLLNVLRRALPIAERNEMELHLETDLDPDALASLLRRCEHPRLKTNWDSGNSSGLGYVAHDEFAAYGDRIGSIHIKDRYRKPEGGIETRPLGCGSANFEDIFRSMNEISYSRGVTLQVARGDSGNEIEFLREQLAFVKKHW